MNGLLLDTNALWWVLSDDPRLGAGSRTRLQETGRVHFSSISVLEITMKEMLGRLSAPGDVAVDAESAGLVELPFRSRHAAGLRDFPSLSRHDPFDRMLLSQARIEELALLTSDRQLHMLGLDWVLDAHA